MDVLPATDMTTLVALRVHRFVPFVSNKDEGDKDAGQKDVGPKDGAPKAAPSQDFPLMSGEETTDPHTGEPRDDQVIQFRMTIGRTH